MNHRAAPIDQTAMVWEAVLTGKPVPRIRVPRKREGRRWCDQLTAAAWNGLPRNRWPGEPLLTLDESAAMSKAALAQLERRDRNLFVAVRAVMEEDYAKDIAALKVSYETWQRFSRKRQERIEKIRASLPRTALREKLGL